MKLFSRFLFAGLALLLDYEIFERRDPFGASIGVWHTSAQKRVAKFN